MRTSSGLEQQTDALPEQLVHLSNGFRLVPGAPALAVGDTVTSSAIIESVANSDSGKTVTVRGTVYRLASANDDGKQAEERVPVIEVKSSFLYRGKFDDYAQTFSRTTSPPFELALASAESVAVLKSKDWFEWDDERTPLKVGATLEVRTESRYTYADKSSYALVEVTGAAFQLSDEDRSLKKVATIEYSSTETTKGDPVLAYLERHAKPLAQPAMFDNDGYALTKDGECTFVTPFTNEDYSHTSGDTNPIHTNPYLAALAGLPGTITHGMHSSARTRKFVEQVVAAGHGARVRSYDVRFTDMCLPGREMSVRLRHVGQTSRGEKLIKVETVDTESGSVVLAGTAEVTQPATAYVFTGQGSQEQGMGMDLYNNSAVARNVWDEADKHLGEVYGFSILEIVRKNPKEKTVHFGGLKGQATRAKYMEVNTFRLLSLWP